MTAATVVDLIQAFDWAILGYFVVVNAVQATLLFSAALELSHIERQALGPKRTNVGSPLLPRITVLVPAYNEASVVTETVSSVMAIDYPDLEVVVVNDGSSDDTMEVLANRYGLVDTRRVSAGRVSTTRIRGIFTSRIYPRLLVVDKVNGGKADALNAAATFATGRLVCAIDADTVIEPDALQRLVRPFLDDGTTIAAGGTVRVANGCELEHARVVRRRPPTNWLAALQAVEYPRAFLFGRLGWNRLGGNVIVSGAFGLFDRDLVLEAGGYADDTVGEDMELVLRLRKVAYDADRPHRVFFLPDPVAWTEAPETVRTLARQRNRWQRGLADVLWRHRRLIGRRRYGRMGTVVLPYYTLVELLAPVVEALGLAGLAIGLAIGAVDVQFAVLFGLLAYGFGLVLSLVALSMERRIDPEPMSLTDTVRHTRWVLFEQVGYRQATVIWRLWGMLSLARGDKHWGTQVRRGFRAGSEAHA